MTRKIILLFLPLLLMSARQDRVDKLYHSFAFQPVPEMITELFQQYNIIFLGETHRIKQQVEFVSKLIPVLQKMGVHVLFYEFINYSDTELSDSLLTAPEYNEELVWQMLRNSEWDWAWQEYADNFRAAWEVNRHRRQGEPPFRIVGIMPDINYAAIEKPEDWDNDEKRMAFWNWEHNKTWLEVIESEALRVNRKALVYCGAHHAFTKFRHPISIDGKFIRYENDREGTTCYLKYPGQVATILFYNPLPRKPEYGANYIQPFGGVIDSIITALPEHHMSFGFITTRSSLGSRTDTLSTYSMGYGSIRLKDLADACIVAGPVAKFSTCTLIDNFITEKDLPTVTIQARPYNWITTWTVSSAQDSLKQWHKNLEENLQKMKNAGCYQNKL